MTLSPAEQDEVKRIFQEHNAIIPEDHFVYAKKPQGWFHGDAYVNKDAIYPHTRAVSFLCHLLADSFWSGGVEVVVGPTVGGVSLAQWTAHWLAPHYSEHRYLHHSKWI